jgi:hypothetical protein
MIYLRKSTDKIKGSKNHLQVWIERNKKKISDFKNIESLNDG